jgi:hypothetical protein
VLDLNEPEAKRLVQQILGTLNERKRRIVELVCLSGMTIPEVAAFTHEPRTRIQNQYYRAIAELRLAAREAEHPAGLLEAQEPMAEKAARKLPGALKVDREEVELG